MADEDEESRYDLEQQRATFQQGVLSPTDTDFGSSSIATNMTPSESITSLQLMLTSIKQERNSDVSQKLVSDGESHYTMYHHMMDFVNSARIRSLYPLKFLIVVT